MPANNIFDLLTDLEKNPTERNYTAREYNLDGFREWLQSIGEPQFKTPCVHIAGTKGKGSTGAMIEAILRSHGLKTGFYTSPHLNHYGERFRFNGVPWKETEFDEKLSQFEQFIPNSQLSGEGGRLRTVFEILTAMAFQYFAEAKVDVAIYETGLGGRLDCTNVVKPEVSVITPIGMDHVQILGNTVEQIALEKAGIIKIATPVVLFEPQTELQDRAWYTIVKYANDHGAHIHQPMAIDNIQTLPTGQRFDLIHHSCIESYSIPLLGVHQARNFSAAYKASEIYLNARGADVVQDAVEGSTDLINWPGRLQIVPGDPTLILDGAHCPLSAHALAQSVSCSNFPEKPPFTLLWGMNREKDSKLFLDTLAKGIGTDSISRIVCYCPPGGRGREVHELSSIASRYSNNVIDAASPENAFSLASKYSEPILACGSLYALGTFEEMQRAG